MTTEYNKYDRDTFEHGGIIWGAKIYASNYGKPLSWLKDNEEVYCHWDDHTSSGPYHVDCVHGWGEDFQIRLPADHWAYPVIAKGFTPWAGGDVAPDDQKPPQSRAERFEEETGIRAGKKVIAALEWAANNPE